VLSTPVVLLESAENPTAVFESPSVLEKSAEEPTAVLPLPRPAPVLSLFASALSPMAVLLVA